MFYKVYKPLLLIVTGAPASGKTTLTRLLADKINCPFISRDALKEGYINTIEKEHAHTNETASEHIYNTFFETVDFLISKDISIIIEAAFQHALWEAKLVSFANKANIKIILCKTNTALLKSRFANRLANHPEREKLHGDHLIDFSANNLINGNYEYLHMNLPTLEVDTTESYKPGIETIISFIKQPL